MQEIFKKVPLFSGLNNDEIDAVIAITTIHNVRKNNIIVQEGDAGNAMFILLCGSVKISYYAPDGRELILSLLEEGSFFGEMSLLDKQPRSATVTTLESVKIAQIRSRDFERLLLKQPALSLKLLCEVVSRLRRTSLILERISTMDVPHRLYSYLQDYCERFGKEKSASQCIVRLPTHQLIADQLSTSRETISRAMSSLKKESIITTTSTRSVCIDTDAIDTLLFAIQ
ncbi:MAG: Crp/Fnr family transcriptional regulator [Mariprofundaceae bacterium]|nr:Crp/Fnr family transcriptional regulator [Mariprofundaceae bacterium]